MSGLRKRRGYVLHFFFFGGAVTGFSATSRVSQPFLPPLPLFIERPKFDNTNALSEDTARAGYTIARREDAKRQMSKKDCKFMNSKEKTNVRSRFTYSEDKVWSRLWHAQNTIDFFVFQAI